MKYVEMLVNGYKFVVGRICLMDWLAPLLLRIYLAPVMIQAGVTKLQAFDSTVDWFGNDEWGLGLPVPGVMAGIVVLVELIGGVFLLMGFLTRIVSLPLIVVMLVAAITVHGENGWLAIADADSWFADGTLYFDASVLEARDRMSAINSLLRDHGNYKWLTSSGKPVILNNGMEFAVTYLLMLLSLLYSGGGNGISLDYWLKAWWRKRERKLQSFIRE